MRIWRTLRTGTSRHGLMTTKRRDRRARRAGLVLPLSVLVCLALLAVPSGALSSGSPTITSDQSDYQPGATVTLTGSGWASEESVRIVVNDTVGQTLQHDVTVVASTEGTIVDSFSLPTYFVSDYDVTATGPSGTATATFTDAALPNSISMVTWKTDNGGAWTDGTLNQNN